MRLRLKDRSKENEQQLHGIIPTRHRFWLGVVVAVLVMAVDTDHVNSNLVDCASTAATVVSLNTFALQHVYMTSSNQNCTERLMSAPLRNYSITHSLTPENNYISTRYTWHYERPNGTKLWQNIHSTTAESFINFILKMFEFNLKIVVSEK